MRSLCTYLAGMILAAPLITLAIPLIILAPGCDGGTSDLEKPAEIKGTMTPEQLPEGYNQITKTKAGKKAAAK